MRKQIYCQSCGCERPNAKAKPGLCKACCLSNNKQKAIKKSYLKLKEMGYEVKSYSVNQHGQFVFEVVRKECAHSFSGIIGNFNKQLKQTGITMCPVCGSNRRMEKCLDGFMDKFGKDYDIAKFEDYRTQVRAESEVTYKKFKHIINPQNVRRGRTTYHLDHKVPIKECFTRGISIASASCLENLQILPYAENISKHARNFCEDLASSLSD